jgi:hypothetical protein
VNNHAQSIDFEGAQGIDQFIPTFRCDFDAQNARELATEPAHPAFEPVAAMIGDARGYHLHETGPIGADDGHDERCQHAGESGASVKSAQGGKGGGSLRPPDTIYCCCRTRTSSTQPMKTSPRPAIMRIGSGTRSSANSTMIPATISRQPRIATSRFWRAYLRPGWGGSVMAGIGLAETLFLGASSGVGKTDARQRPSATVAPENRIHFASGSVTRMVVPAGLVCSRTMSP